MQVVVHRVKVCQALARAQLLGHQLDPELQAGIHCALLVQTGVEYFFHSCLNIISIILHMISRVFLNVAKVILIVKSCNFKLS